MRSPLPVDAERIRHRRGSQRLSAVVSEVGTATWSSRRAVDHARNEKNEDDDLLLACDTETVSVGWAGVGPARWAVGQRLGFFFSVLCLFFFHFLISIQLFEFNLTLQVFDFMTSYKIQLIIFWHNLLEDTLQVYYTCNTLYIV
jgi:hypothetical protein